MCTTQSDYNMSEDLPTAIRFSLFQPTELNSVFRRANIHRLDEFRWFKWLNWYCDYKIKQNLN